MAAKKTAPFTLTERLTLDNDGIGQVATAIIDLGSYVDVGDRQGLMIHKVDYIFQGTTAGGFLDATFGTTPAEVQVQVTDLNRGQMVFADDRSLISSARLLWAGSHADRETDLYPDNFGKGAMDGRTVVNDALYIVGQVDELETNQSCNVTVRVTASIVSLSAKDFMAIAIQSTAADN